MVCQINPPGQEVWAQFQTDSEKLGLKGSVRIVVEKQKPVESSSVLEMTREFNTEGNLIEYTARTLRTNSSNSTTEGLKTKFTYDATGQRMSEFSFRLDGMPYQKVLYGRDQLGTSEMEAKYSADGSFMLLKLIRRRGSPDREETLVYTSYPPHFLRIESHYDANARKTFVLKSPGDETTIKIHDAAGHVVEAKSYRGSAEANSSTTTYKYDEQGNPLEEITYKNEVVTDKVVNSYAYDNIGNWIRKRSIWVIKDGNTSSEITLITRDISYIRKEE